MPTTSLRLRPCITSIVLALALNGAIPSAAQIPMSRPDDAPTTAATPAVTPPARVSLPPQTRPAPVAAPRETPVPVAPDPAQVERFATFQRQIASAIEQSDWDLAVIAAEGQYAAFPTEMKATADLGRIYYRRGSPKEAEALLRLATTQPTKLYTGNAPQMLGAVYADLGRLMVDTHRATEAIALLQRSIDLAPSNVRTRYLLATAFGLVGDQMRGDREVRVAFGVDTAAAGPSDYLLLAGAQQRAGDKTVSVTLEKGLARFPSQASFASPLRSPYASADSSRRLSTSSSTSASHAATSSHTPVRSRGRFPRCAPRLQHKRKDEELTSLVAYVAHAAEDRHDDALSALHEVARLNAGAPAALQVLLAEQYAATGRYSEAERRLTALLVSQPALAPALVNLATLYIDEGRWARASDLLERLASTSPSNSKLPSLRARLASARAEVAPPPSAVSPSADEADGQPASEKAPSQDGGAEGEPNEDEVSDPSQKNY